MNKQNLKPIGQLVPQAIDIGFCPVNQTTVYQIQLHNRNNEFLEYDFEATTFDFSPKKGVLAPKQKQNISISYTPSEATVVISKAILNIQNEDPVVIKISAIGKYPFININQKQLEFKQVLVGMQKTKDLVIKNSSQVPAKFLVSKIQSDEFKDNSFSVDCSSGEIPPNSSYLVKIIYKPTIANLISVTQFEITCPGGNSQQFECSGLGQNFSVYCNVESINYGEIRLGQQTSRLLTVHNDSELPVRYQFFNQKGNIFSFSCTRGTIPAKQSVRIIINFVPQNTISYYERVFGIVQNHSLLYVDLIGTCYDLLLKPATVVQRHVDLFRQRVVDGRLSLLDMKYMENSMVQNNSNLHNITQKSAKLMDKNNTDNPQSDFDLEKMPETLVDGEEEEQNYENQVVLHKELFLENQSTNKLMQLSEEMIDFGFNSFMTVSGGRELVLTNNLPVKMEVYWTVQSEYINDHQKVAVFNVFPQTAIVKPNSSVRFEFSFRPNKTSSYFEQMVQFFATKHESKSNKQKQEEMKAFKQSQKSSVKSTEYEIIPPIYGAINCVGHSFPPTSQTFIPMISIDPNERIQFPPCSLGDSMYQTVTITNKTDTSTYFKFSKDVHKVFRVFPLSGLIEGKSFQVILIEFKPNQTKLFNSHINCALNHSQSNSLSIQLSGFCSKPDLWLQNEGQIYFPPSYTGVFSRQKVKIQNLSRVPTDYTIIVPEKYVDEVFIEPKNGTMKPNESKFLECSFIPLKKKQYRVNIPITLKDVIDDGQNLAGYYHPGSGNPEKRSIEVQRLLNSVEKKFEIIGAGGDGSLKLEPSIIDFGIVKVNFDKKVYATLENFSNFTFYIELTLKATKKGNRLDIRQEKLIENCFSLDFKEGIIAANSKIDVGITFNPIEVCDFDIELECVAKERPLKGVLIQSTKKFVSSKCKITVHGKGNFPNLKIVDVRNESVSVATLWENFSINKINKELENELSEDEKKFLNIELLKFTEANSLMKRLNAYQWNFGYLPIKPNIAPRKIVITIQNVGGTDLSWNFKLPSDSQIQVEHWADPGEPTEEEAFEKAIIERKIFEIKPRCGDLKPGQLADIELIFSPGNDNDLPFGVDKNSHKKNSEKFYLQVVLQILNGKPLLLQFKGMTLAPNEGLLALRKNDYTLPKIPIGFLLPVTFPIEINNVGSVNVNYKVEITEITKDERKSTVNVDSKYKIFDIQNLQGMINPGEKSYLYCLFRPLEAQMYEFNLKINVYDFHNKKIDEINVKVQGEGFYGSLNNQLKNHQEELPSQRSQVSTLGSKVFFSIEEIDFGEMSREKTEHRVIILYNQSLRDKLTFKFKKTGLICGDNLILEPLNGELEPGSFIEIKLSLISNMVPSMYEGEIECLIKWTQNSNSVESTMETLFLRIKKKSQLNRLEQTLPYEYSSQDNDPNKHACEIIMIKAINDILNEVSLDQLLNNIDDQPIQLYNNFDDQEPVKVDKISKGLENAQNRISQYNYKIPNHLYTNDEFTEITEQILDNTFFNLIQESTRQESDLLKVSKTFLTPNIKK